MPDRAEVACSRCGYPHPLGMEGDSCMAAARVAVNQPPPRAVCAISEDRQWLVVLDNPMWTAYERLHVGMDSAYVFRYILADDTGQSAEDVLAMWLSQRGS